MQFVLYGPQAQCSLRLAPRCCSICLVYFMLSAEADLACSCTYVAMFVLSMAYSSLNTTLRQCGFVASYVYNMHELQLCIMYSYVCSYVSFPCTKCE